MLVHEWLPSVVSTQTVPETSGEPWYLFGHCTEVTALPGAPAQWAAIFARFGAKLESVSVGCCGMAGTYGHEVVNHANSLGIYELSASGDAASAAKPLSGDRLLLPQPVKRVEGSGVRHPLQALLEIMG